MRTLSLIVLLASLVSFADPPKDVPVPMTVTVTLTEKELDGILITMARLEAENKALRNEVKAAPVIHPLVIVGAVVAGLTVGAVGTGLLCAKTSVCRPP